MKPEIYSSCCGAGIDTDSFMCSDCQDHCSAHICFDWDKLTFEQMRKLRTVSTVVCEEYVESPTPDSLQKALGIIEENI